MASKFAVRGMTMAAATEYAHKHIRINAVAPTGTETPMLAEYIATAPDPDVVRTMITAANALPGLPQPCDIAAATAFLLSEDARFITGHTLPVDAGAFARIANAHDIPHAND